MKNFFQKLSNAFEDCNGPDTLGRWAMGAGLVFAVLDIFFYNAVFTVLYMAFLFYAVYRLFSRKVGQRQEENERFEAFLDRIKGKAGRKGGDTESAKPAKAEVLHIKCEKCGQRLRVPKGKGRIRVTCPTCQHQSIMET